MRTEVRVLGPLQVLVDGRPVALGGRRQQAVLAILVAARGRTVPAERLIAHVWADGPPPRPFASLQVYVSRLRRVLEPDRSPRAAAQVLISDGDGYALRLPENAVDAWRFVAGAGRAPDAADAAAQAHAVLRDTLAGWRGTPFASFADEPWARPEITRLTQAYLLARERDILALIRLTHTGDAVLFAQDLAESQPLRASAWWLYALSLWTAHRSADALDVLRRHRRLLTDDLGLTPDESIAEMERAILVQRQSYLDEVIGTGAGESSVLPARLPRVQPGFVARDTELADLDRHADGLVVITGTGGVGKTSLAIRWAHRATGRFPGGCLYADLRGFGPHDIPAAPAEVLAAFLTALEVPDQWIPPGEAARTALFRSLLAGRRMLIVLDNAYDAEQIRPLLPGEGSCLVVVTSRNRMTSLVVSDGAHVVPLAVLDAEESRDYLYTRIGQDIVDGEPHARDTIVARCGGLPLALALVCARDRGIPLATIAEEMDGPLTGLWPVFSWSLRQLPAADAELFRLLALHPGRHVTPAAATTISGQTRAATRAALSRLADAHLLDERQPGRFACHDLLRTFAAQDARRTVRPEIREDILRRLIEYYLYSATSAAARFATSVPPAAPGPSPDDITPEQFSDAESALSWMADAYDDILALAATAPQQYRGPLAAALHPYQQGFRFHGGDSIAFLHEVDVAA